MRKSILIIVSIVIPLLFILPPNNSAGMIASGLLVLLSFSTIIISAIQKDATFLIIYIYMAMYVIPPISYYFGGHNISLWRDQCQTPDAVYQTTLAMLLFYVSLIWGQWHGGKIQKIKYSGNALPLNNNNLGYTICAICAIICILFGKSGETILDSGGYGNSENVQISSLYGYGILPLLIGLQFSNSAIKRNVIFSLCGIYIIKDLLYGGRVDTIQLCLGLYILYFRYKWTMRKTLSIGLLGFSFMTLWGIYRAAIDRGLLYAYSEFISDIGGEGNAREVFYSSMRVEYLIETGVLTPELRIEALFNFIASIIIPYSWLPPIANLSSWSQDFASSGGGGLFPVYITTICSSIGLAGISFFIGKSFRKFQQGKASTFFKYWVILAIITVPRWFAYYPISLFKLALLGSIVYCIAIKVFPNKKTNKSILNRPIR